jgi:hypothetical protein
MKNALLLIILWQQDQGDDQWIFCHVYNEPPHVFGPMNFGGWMQIAIIFGLEFWNATCLAKLVINTTTNVIFYAFLTFRKKKKTPEQVD